MDNEQQYMEPQEEERHIDFGQLLAALLKHKKLYWKVLPITFVVACIIALSLPSYYTCEVQLAPELSTRGSGNSLSALASSFGLKMGSGTMGTEALYPTLYPDLVNSTDFKITLFNVPIHKKDSTRVMTYYDYLMYEQKMPWWSRAMSAAFESLFSLLGAEPEEQVDSINPFELTKQQTAIVKSLDKKVVCDVDNKTLVITITVTDQDPLICATMADSVKGRLQDFITEYRTKKARYDLDYNRKLYEEAKARYDESRRRYGEYADANQDVVLQSVRMKIVDLENDMQLQYNTYSALLQQLRAAEAKVMEETPSFTILQSATVPVRKSGPGRTKIVLVFLFLAFLGTSAWILHKENQLKPLLGLS